MEWEHHNRLTEGQEEVEVTCEKHLLTSEPHEGLKARKVNTCFFLIVGDFCFQ